MHQTLSDRVLFVDDDEAVRTTFRRSMRKAGIPCDIAADANEAIEFAKRHAYCVVATDYAMPGLTGLELRDSLRELQSDATFVLITAQCTLELALQATNEHAFTYVLTKPWRSAELHSLMNRAAEEAWERSSARTLAQRSVERQGSSAPDHAALLTAVSSIVSQVSGSNSPDLQRRTDRYRGLCTLVCDALHLDSLMRRDVDMAAVVLAASSRNFGASDPAGWLPKEGPFAGAQTALAQVNERWDGRGEPLGRPGDETDRRAQVLNAIRAFDDMLTRDPTPLTLSASLAEAKEHLISRAGAEFSPRVVRAMLGISETDIEQLYGEPEEAVFSLVG